MLRFELWAAPLSIRPYSKNALINFEKSALKKDCARGRISEARPGEELRPKVGDGMKG
jgi:hypothetical protein